MPLQAIDVQTNIANIGKLAKENHTQQMVERGQLYGQLKAQEQARLAQSRLFKMEELLEPERSYEYAEEEQEEQKRRRIRHRHEALQKEQEEQNSANHRSNNDHPALNKGKFVDRLG